jgi:hypothetical protein
MRAWKPDAAAVASKVIDGEAIIMNLTNGAYYSLDGVGALIWEGIEQALSREGIVARVDGRYAVDAARVQADFDRLVAELLAEGVIVETEAKADAAATPAEGSPARTYIPPSLIKYTEMADLLALDPPMPALEEIPGKSARAG